MIRKAVFDIFIFIVVSFFLYSLVKSFDIKETLSFLANLSIWKLGIHYFISLLIFYFWIKRWEVFLQANNLPTVFKRLLSYRVIDFAVSYLVPSGQIGGAPVRASIYSKREDRELGDVLATVVSDKFVEIASVIIFVIFTMFILIVFGLLPNNHWEAISLLGFSLVLFLMGGFYYLLAYKKKFLFYIHNILPKFFREKASSLESFLVMAFKKEKLGIFYQAMVFSFIALIVSVIEYWTGVWALGVDLALSEAIIIMVIITISYSLPLPAGIGSLEAASVLAFQLVGLPGTLGLAYAVLVRLRDFTYTLIGAGLFYSHHLFWDKK